MTALADDELWSAIGDPSRRRVLDLLVSLSLIHIYRLSPLMNELTEVLAA